MLKKLLGADATVERRCVLDDHTGIEGMKHRGLELISFDAVVDEIARTPLDHYVVWDGSNCSAQANSLCSRALSLIFETWSPVPLRALLQRASSISDGMGLNPEAVRRAVRGHQSARPAAYLLVRRTPSGDYVAVADVPWPTAADGPLRAGDVVLDRYGRRFGKDGPEECSASRRLRTRSPA